MSFLSPFMFAFAAVLPVIVVLYLLKLKRQRMEISSTMLWLKSIQDLTANAPFQKLRNNLLLWLQLLIALLCVLALARPFLAMDTTRRETLLVFIDTSASMQATDVNDHDTRLDQAKDFALELANGLGPDDAMLPITFSSRAQTLISAATDDRAELRGAIHAIEPTDQPTNFRDAMAMIRSLSQVVSHPKIVIISDGAFGGEIEDLVRFSQEADSPPVRYLRCGTGGQNVGITAFSLNRALEDQRRVQIFAEVSNTSVDEIHATLELYLDEERIDVKSIDLAAEQSRGVIFSNMGDIAGEVRLQLNVDDSLPTDNIVHGVLNPQRDMRVLLVSDRTNPYIANIMARQDALTFARLPVDQFDPVIHPQRHDLVILDGYCPEELSEGNYVIMGVPLPIEGYTSRPVPLEFPPVVDWDRSSPLTRFCDFTLITVGEALDQDVPDSAQVLVETNHGPLISLIELGPTSILHIGFDPYESDWPWLASFPVFMTNTVQHFRGRLGITGQLCIATGDALQIPIRSDVDTLSIIEPDGDEVPLTFAPGTGMVFHTNTDRSGLYTVRDNTGREIVYAASLLDDRETSILPTDTLGTTAGGIVAETEVVRANTEVWRYLAWFVLAVLCLEWFLYLRRSWL